MISLDLLQGCHRCRGGDVTGLQWAGNGGREQESNLPGIARRPQPGLKSGRPTGAASPPLALFHVSGRFGKLLQEHRFLVGLQATAVQPQAPVVDPPDHRAR